MSESARRGRRIDAGLHLLDRQLIDCDGSMAGKVDDLELVEREDGPPYVVAILSGPGALAHRIGGRFGAWLESVHARLQHPSRRGPARIWFGLVSDVDVAVHLSVPAEDLESHESERWARDHVIGHIPGNEHAAD